MNTSQSRKYGGHFYEGKDPINRWARCAYCPYKVERRRVGNARASSAKLRGEMMRHLRERHPKEIA
jgi:hypothetical protein